MKLNRLNQLLRRLRRLLRLFRRPRRPYQLTPGARTVQRLRVGYYYSQPERN